jgi:uroporphyrinogen decarboxylase
MRGMSGAKPSRLVRALTGETLDPPPWWLMRQAGRYLPEYRALREKAPDFIEFCLTPALAAEATLQPVRRFGMDAAILFADILLVPRALGQRVGFGDEGPVLEPVEEIIGLAGLSPAGVSSLEPVYETVRLSRASLSSETGLIGFAGAPWTVATYMVEGGASRDFRRVKSWAYRDPVGFAALLDLVGDATFSYLSGQIAAGVDAVQLFDSWAGVLPEREFERWVIAPTRRIVQRLKQKFPSTPVIGFPRGAAQLYERYTAETGIDAVGTDTVVPLDAARRLQPRVCVQGNLDPVMLLTGGSPLAEAVAVIRKALGEGPFVFNLGHGVLPQTPPEHVAELARLLSVPINRG